MRGTTHHYCGLRIADFGFQSPISSRRWAISLDAGSTLRCALLFLAELLLVGGGAALAQEAPAQQHNQPEPQPPTLRLTLKQAAEIAVQPNGNARIRLAQEMIRQAQARSAQARAALLPDVSAGASQQNQTRNLEAMGIHFNIPIPGFVFPTFVGPFTTFDARATLAQSIFDFSSIRRFQASRAGIGVAEAENDDARDGVREQAARAYLAALRAEAALAAAGANVDLSEAMLQLAVNQKGAGTGTGIEVTRAKVQLANDRQRLLAAQNEREASRLRLLRALGLHMNVEVELADSLEYVPAEAPAPAPAVATALESRADWRAQQRREEWARLTHSATKLERLPTVVGFADYGSIGTAVDAALPTRTYGVSLRLPVFDGGRRDARRAETASQLRQEGVRTRDLRDQIEMEIRIALDSLGSAEAQVKAAQEGLALAQDELAQAQRRYQAGVTSSIEVTDAQTRLERARENRILALFNHNLARIDLAAATGTIRRLVQ
jgi:outer membrane protein TolC